MARPREPIGRDAGSGATAASPGRARTSTCASGSPPRPRPAAWISPTTGRQPVGLVGRPGRCGDAGGPASSPASTWTRCPTAGRSTARSAWSPRSPRVDALRARGFVPGRPLGVVNFADEEGARFGVACAGSRLHHRGAGRRPGARRSATPTGHDGRGAAARPAATRASSAATRRPCAGSAPSSSCTSSRAAAWSTPAHAGRPRQPTSGRTAAGGSTSPARPTTPARPAWTTGSDAMLGLCRDRARRPRRRRARTAAWPRSARSRSSPDGVNAIAVARHRLARRPRRRRGRRAPGGRRRRRRVRESTAPVTEESWTPTDRVRRRPARAAARACSAARPSLGTGAGHDAGILADAGIPTAMLFVRNPTGVSHSPAEHAERDDCLAGVEALADVARPTWRGRCMTTLLARARLAARRRRGDGALRRRPTAAFTEVAPGRRPSPATTAPARRRAARASPTPTATPSTGPCAAGPTTSGGTFWTWRDAMYAVAAPPRPRQLPRAGPGGLRRDGARRRSPRSASSTTCTTPRAARRYADPNAMGAGAVAAAARGRHPAHPARHLLPRRRADGDGHLPLDARAAAVHRRHGRRVGRRGSPTCPTTATARIGAAVHSVRAVPRDAPGRVGRGRRATAARCTSTCPSSRPRTRACEALLRRARPTALLAEDGLLGPSDDRGARHPPDRRRHRAAGRGRADRVLLPDHRARPCRRHRPGPARCATPGRRCRSAPTSTRSSTCSRRPAALEMHERLATRERGRFAGGRPARDGGHGNGTASLGWPDGGLIARRAPRRPGRRADSTAHAPPDARPTSCCYAATAADVDTMSWWPASTWCATVSTGWATSVASCATPSRRCASDARNRKRHNGIRRCSGHGHR